MTDRQSVAAEGRLQFPTATGISHIVVERSHDTGNSVGLAVVGHGAGGGVDAPDLLAVRAALLAAGFVVARLTQPYRVAGRRAPDAAAKLDAAFTAGVEVLRDHPGLRELPLLVGGRSSGARVACRTAAAAGAIGVMALAFPLAPPGRPDRSRVGELLLAARPTLVVQGSRDPFGTPQAVTAAAAAEAGGRPPAWLRVVAVEAADHSFRTRRADGRTAEQCLRDVADAARDFAVGLVS